MVDKAIQIGESIDTDSNYESMEESEYFSISTGSQEEIIFQQFDLENKATREFDVQSEDVDDSPVQIISSDSLRCSVRLMNKREKKEIQLSGNLFYCLTCSKSFSQLRSLKLHSHIHTEEKRYKCGSCSKSYSGPHSLRIHTRTHTRQRPYACSVCPKSFSSFQALKTHMRIHTEEKTFRCLTCSKSFSRLSILKSHTRIHTGKKPYESNLCPKVILYALPPEHISVLIEKRNGISVHIP